jgi:hypothetical protein
VIYRDPAAYVSHPCVTRLANGDHLVAFCESLPRRPHLHPPADPRFVNLVARSRDSGFTWEAPRAGPDYEWTGLQCPAITQISNGDVLLSQCQFGWLPLETAMRRVREGKARSYMVQDKETRAWHAAPTEVAWERAAYPWARYNRGSFIQLSHDGGVTWDRTVRIETEPHTYGYSPRPPVELADGTLVLALGNTGLRAVPATVYVVRSRDGGRTWGAPITAIAPADDRWVNEPSLLPLPDGRLLLMAREARSFLYCTESTDGGLTWSAARQTGIWGFPPHLLSLQDGRVLCVYGHRRPPYGIRACWSEDGGRSWALEAEIVLRDDLKNGNCGYPTAVQEPDGSLFVTYYTEDDAGVTFVLGSHVRF